MIQSPVLIIGCPRSGTTLLFNILSEVPGLWSIGYESKEIVERYHAPAAKGWVSGALGTEDLTDESRAYMLRAFELGAAPGSFWRRIGQLRKRLGSNRAYGALKRRGRTTAAGAGASSALPQHGLDVVRAFVRAGNRLFPAHRPVRLVEKTPENCLRLPFLLALFPDARVLYLTRDGRSNVHSLMEGWAQPHLFPGYRVPEKLAIPGYTRERWAFTLIPGWRALAHSPLEEVCAWQWIRCNEAVLAHREETVGQVPYLTIRYEDLVAQPGQVLHEVASFLELDFERDLGRNAEHLPQINAVSAPNRDKWRKQDPQVLARIEALIGPTMERLGHRE
ncbi:MAG TPA: sulfotransferase [Anaerolineae bacterium]|nr:sulfotransferase [Anaerolineae bacterium]